MVCKLKEWETSDAKDLAAALSNKKVLDNLRDGPPFPYTEKDALDYISFVLSADKTNSFAYAVEADGKVVGSVGVFRKENIHFRTAELGYYLSEDYWNRGIMTEAVKLLCKKVFAESDIIRIFAEPFTHNTGSCRVLEKCGFLKEGVMKKNAFKNGKVCDMALYALTKEE